jgi:hypothetical protein
MMPSMCSPTRASVLLTFLMLPLCAACEREGAAGEGAAPADAAPDGAPDLVSTNPDVLGGGDLVAADSTADPGVEGDPDTVPDDARSDVAGRHTLDDLLRLNHAQVVGTHNSYHVAGSPTIPQWDYTHLPLDEQVAWQGVRQFELDLYYDHANDDWKVMHVPILDAETNCFVLGDCLSALKGWSDQNPWHYPFVVMIELKEGFKEEGAAMKLMRLEEIVLSVWPEERLITPDQVRGGHDSLSEAIAEDGWPTLGEIRGRLMMIMHTRGEWQPAYRGGLDSSAGLLLFPDASGDASLPYAAFHAVNDPREAEKIAALVDAGHLVRTRADVDGSEAISGDRSRADAAIESAAHFISTDFPRIEPGEGYGVMIPGGMPTGCNPRTAPPDCSSADVE